MLVTKYYKTREDGIRLLRTYSDLGFQLERNGVLYDDAIDPENECRTYKETNILIPQPPTE